MMDQSILGKSVREIYHGFEGIAIATTEHLHGCDRVLIEPTTLLKGGRLGQSISFDVHRIEVLGDGPERTMDVVFPTTPLGATARHKLNGLEGIVSSRSAWIGHCPRVDIEPLGRDENGEMMEPLGFDEDLIEVISEEPPRYATREPEPEPVEDEPKPKRKTGGPHPNASWATTGRTR